MCQAISPPTATNCSESKELEGTEKKKKLSIITINYNNRDGLRKTIESVVAQTTRDFEYIVIDGGSTDGSVDVINEYTDHIDYWVSEADKGIYNAMNKGVKAAHGEFLLFLNSGDWLNSTDVTEVILPHLTDKIDILSGFILWDGTFGRQRTGSSKCLTISTILHYGLSHQSTFIRRSLLVNRPYNENFRIISDWIFFLETSLFDSPRYQHIDFDLAVFEGAGLSSNDERLKREGDKFWPTFLSDHAVRDISSIPPELFAIFRQIPTSFKFKKLCIRIISGLFKIYSIIWPKAIHKCDIPCIKINKKIGEQSIKIRFNDCPN